MLKLLSLEVVKIQNVYQPAGHIVTGNLKISSDSRIRNIVSKGPKYRFSSYINFDIASALNDFGNRWCKPAGVEDSALKTGKVTFIIVDKHIVSFTKYLSFTS